MVKRIMHVIRPAEGGMKEHLISLVKNMDNRIFETAVVCPSESSIAENLKGLRLKIYEVNMDGNLNPRQDLGSILKIKKCINDFNPDILHTHGAKAGLLGRLANIGPKGPINIATVHNFVLENKVAFWKKAIYKELEKALAKHTHGFITVSEALKEHISKQYKISPSKIETIYNGINTSRFANFNYEVSSDLTSIKRKKEVIVGVVARLAPQKGVNFFIKGAKIINAKYPYVKFLIVGDGPERRRLEILRNHLGLEKTLLFLGVRKDIKDILKKLDIYVLPSISEGLSISTLEAMASGCPVIATNVGGVPEIVKNNFNGLLINPGNPTEIANAVFKLLEDRRLAQSLAKEGVEFTQKHFEQSIMVEKTQELYKKLSLPESVNVV